MTLTPEERAALTPEQAAYVRELTYGIRNGDGRHIEDELVEWCCRHLDGLLDERDRLRTENKRLLRELAAAHAAAGPLGVPPLPQTQKPPAETGGGE